MSSITLYGPPRAPFVIKVRGALAVKKLDYTLVEPTSPKDYRRWSPVTGLLPVIDVDGTRVHDSAAILDYLDERFPDPPLVAKDPKVAASQRRLEAWVEASLMFYWTNYLRELVSREATASDANGGLRGAGRRIRRRAAAVHAGSDGLAAEFTRRLDDLVNFLGGRPFFYADRISRADLAVYSFLRNIPDAAGREVSAELDARPVLREHLTRVEQEAGGAF